MAEVWRLKKLQVDAPPEGDLLPRWRYKAILEETTTGALVDVAFLSDDEDPETPVDLCNTIAGLVPTGEFDTECE